MIYIHILVLHAHNVHLLIPIVPLKYYFYIHINSIQSIALQRSNVLFVLFIQILFFTTAILVTYYEKTNLNSSCKKNVFVAFPISNDSEKKSTEI